MNPITLNNEDVDLSSDEKVRVAIRRLKNNKAAEVDGLPAELFKTSGIELIRCMHQLINKIWLVESMPDEWNLSVLCTVLKKGNPAVCANYKGISIIAYKILLPILCERLKHYADEIISSYQCGFRPRKSTIDQKFTLR